MIARNHSRTAFDGRRSASKRGQPFPRILDLTPHVFPLAEVPKLAPQPRFEPHMVLIPGVLLLGQYNRLLDSFTVMINGKLEQRTRAQLNDGLKASSDLRIKMETLYKNRTPSSQKEPESVPLLAARCPSAKISTVQRPALSAAA